MALAWMIAVVVVLGHEIVRPWLAVVLVGLAVAVTAATTLLLRSNPATMLRPAPALFELACGIAVVVGDGWVYKSGHVFGSSQTLGVVWPLCGVLAVGVAMGRSAGAAAGLSLGIARVFDAFANGIYAFSGRQVLSVISTGVVYGLAGATLGHIVALLRGAREEVAEAYAREEVARTLHDGVLQTLAVIQRRSDDSAIAVMARDQERELRDYLYRTRPTPRTPTSADLAAGLRAAAARFEERFGATTQVLVPDDLAPLSGGQVAAITGAVREALTNAGKHGSVSRVIVYVEPDPDHGVFCSVKDDGVGFDPVLTLEGVGLAHSVRARIAEVGGRVEVRSAPGEGTEVCLWLA